MRIIFLAAVCALPHILFRLWLALFCSFLLGFGDAGFNVQLIVFLVVHYKQSESAAAFAILTLAQVKNEKAMEKASQYFSFKCGRFKDTMASIAFVLGQYLNLDQHLLVLVIFALVGCACYFAAESRLRTPSNKITPPNASTATPTTISSPSPPSHRVDAIVALSMQRLPPPPPTNAIDAC